MITINVKAIIASGLALSTLLMASSPAHAEIDERLVYPGANCKKLLGTGEPTFDTNGVLLNNSSSTLTVLCPMYDNGNFFAGDVFVVDNSASANISCQSRTANPLGNPNVTQTQTTSGFSSDTKTLSFTGPTATGTFTYRFYICSLPSGTALLSYSGRANF